MEFEYRIEKDTVGERHVKALSVYESEGFYVMWFLLKSMFKNGFPKKCLL